MSVSPGGAATEAPHVSVNAPWFGEAGPAEMNGLPGAPGGPTTVYWQLAGSAALPALSVAFAVAVCWPTGLVTSGTVPEAGVARPEPPESEAVNGTVSPVALRCTVVGHGPMPAIGFVVSTITCAEVSDVEVKWPSLAITRYR